jgi:hypothetical protein
MPATKNLEDKADLGGELKFTLGARDIKGEKKRTLVV